jgi:YD repeat-containing protein
MKIALPLFVLVLSCISKQANAQYYETTHRQTEDEIQKFKKLKVKTVTISLTEAGSEVPYSITQYDTSGRIFLIANLKHHEHFNYDQNGRMLYWLDSANDGRRFEKFEYRFSYDPSNRLVRYTTNKTNSQFIYDPSDAKETVTQNGVVIEKHDYFYTPEGKLTLEVFKDTSGKVLYQHKTMYNKYGDLASEIVVNPLKKCAGDSATSINTYDSKAHMIQKQKTLTTFSCDLRVANGPITKTTVNQKIVYTYDASGRMATETMTASDPALNYKREFQYSDDGLLAKETIRDDKGKPTKTMLYRYYYFNRKK